ncbi:HesA/MoeB/ThiF family protein [Saccharopolyspora spinosa]|uniref:Molybdopterin/thiamine biosynthesis adenylyltransferase n=1 Tax=Saccharopolyspora spinosa TaxID=60894 RepID=A0A2N3XWP1_SACSN|nr:ThiF family adenylyltransferase [Saccharopolyspora spinosa]PKW15050.1 molybdopterin/thiamine biosynthesis adenylyltransferase [Saccharopolyspora spinosa]
MARIQDIVFGAGLWRELHGHLIGPDGNEQLAFVLASHNVSRRRVRMVAREIIAAGPGDLAHQSPVGIGPTAEFVARALTRCRQEGWSLIEVHSHPFDASDASTFSSIDWGNDRAKMPQLAAMLPAPFQHATMVVGQRSLDAHYYERESETIAPIERVTVVGDASDGSPLLRHHAVTSQPAPRPARPDERHARQLPLLGAEVQDALAKAAVAVVGLGGLGSFVASELAYLGVGRLVLVDPDRVEEHNLNRLIGARHDDVGRPKVDVFREVLERAAPATAIDAVTAPMLAPDALEQLKAVDLLLGCVDNHGARLTLNHLAVRYLIPFLDAGTGVRLAPEGAHFGGQVQLVVPGTGCLECRGFIDPRRAAFDLATPETRAYERAHGYGTEEPAPSVIFLNGIVGSMQVAEAVRILGPTPGREVPRLVIYDGTAQKAFAASEPDRPDCPTCGVDGVAGVADLAPLQAAESPREFSVASNAAAEAANARSHPAQ